MESWIMWIIGALFIIIFMAAAGKYNRERSELIQKWAIEHGFSYSSSSDESSEPFVAMLENDISELLNEFTYGMFNILTRRWDGISVRICEYEIEDDGRKKYCFVVIESEIPITWTGIRSVLPKLPLRTELALDKRRKFLPRCVHLSDSEVGAIFPILPPKTLVAIDSRRIVYRYQHLLSSFNLNSLLAEIEYIHGVLLNAVNYSA